MTNPTTLTETPEQALPVQDVSVNRLITIGLITRLLTDTGVQIFFPFLPVIAKGMGVSTVMLGRLLSLRSATGLTAPAFGLLADRRGYRYVMRLGLLLAAVGYGLMGLSTSLWLSVPGIILIGLGTFSFVPTIQAYLSAKLPFERRARGLGILEYAWALSGIVGLYLVGQLIELTSWRVPMFILSGSLLLAYLLYGRLPAARTFYPPSSPTAGSLLAKARDFLYLGSNGRSAWATIFISAALMLAALNLFITYGTWLTNEYGLSPGRLGTIALILGLADLAGSGLVSLISDQLGKRRSVILGSGLGVVAFALLPWLNTSLNLILLGFVVARFLFEFAVVANMTLASEQAPAQRGKLMTLSSAVSLMGATLAGFISPWAYESYGAWGIGFLSSVWMLVAFLLLLFFVNERAER